MSNRIHPTILALVVAGTAVAVPGSMLWADDARPRDRVLTGKDALGDWTTDAPGVRRKITVDDLATPYDTPSAKNFPGVVTRPEGAWPKAPEGFEVTEFATGLAEPRVIVRAPNGDLFVAESRANRIRVFRDADGDGKPEMNEVFATGLDRPFGIAFYPPGPSRSTSTSATPTRSSASPYQNGDTKARAGAEMIVKDIPSGNEQVGGGGHWTRDLEFSPDGKTLFVSVGSRSNVSDDDDARSAGPTSWPSTPTARTSGSTPGASATPSAWRSIPRPASSGPRSTSATPWATTWCPTTSRTSRKAASTAGPGTTSARTRTRATRASTPS